MALQLGEAPSRKLRIILSIVVVFSFIIPLGLSLDRISRALDGTTPIVINEFSANGQSDWVEVYNTTDQTVNVEGWQLRDSTETNHKTLSGSIAARSFLVIEFNNYLNMDQDTIRLLDASGASIDTITYDTLGSILYPGEGQTSGRTWDGGSVWETGAPTKGVTNDVTPPSIPTGGQPHEAFRATEEFDFTWNASTDNSGDAVRYQFRSSLDPAQVGTIPEGSGAWESGILDSPSILSTGAGNGTWYWQVRAIDAAGNKSAWSEVWNMTKDTQDPTLEVIQPAEGQIFGNHETLTVTSILSDNIGLENYHIYMGDIEGRPESEPQGFSVGLMIKAIFNTGDFTSGPRTITIDVTDKAGRKTETTRTVTIDKTSPTIDITGPDPLMTVGKSKKVTVAGVASDDTSYATKVELHLSKLKSDGECGAHLNTLITDVKGNDWSLEYDTSELESGKYCWTAVAIDAAGNRSTDTYMKYFTVDNTAPVAMLNLISAPNPSASTPITLAGDIDDITDFTSLKLLVNNEEAVDLTSQVGSNGQWQYVLSEGLAQGAYTLRVIATDVYGNMSTLEGSPLSRLQLNVGPYIPPANSSISRGLTAGLDDPFLVPGEVSPVPVPDNPRENSRDVLGAHDDGGSFVEQAGDAAVAVTEAGWKLFGVMWYWWLLGATGLASAAWGATALARRRLAEDVL